MVGALEGARHHHAADDAEPRGRGAVVLHGERRRDVAARRQRESRIDDVEVAVEDGCGHVAISAGLGDGRHARLRDAARVDSVERETGRVVRR